MKILHLIYDHVKNPWVGGGGAVRAYEIYKRLAERHEITIVCGKFPGSSDYNEGKLCVKFVGTSRSNYVLSTFCYAARAAGYVKDHAGEYDVVIEDFAPYNPVFSFLWKKDAVLQLHQREGLVHLKKYAVLGILFFLVEKYYHRLFLNAITISGASKNRFGLAARAAIIPNGFDPSLMTGDHEEGDYELFLGRLHIGQKGLDTLSKALSMSSCRLVIAGTGKDEGKAKKLFSNAVDSGLAEFAGFVKGEEKKALLRKCLCLIVPSRYEGQPLTVIEAAACGRPVIVSDIPELKYAIDAGFGISFRTGDEKDLAEKMNYLLNNSSLRHEMGTRAKEYAKNYTWDIIAEEFEDYLFSAVREGKRK